MTVGTDPVEDTAAGSDEPIARHRRGAWARRLGVTALAAFIAAGLLGVWGVRDGTATASGEGLSLHVRFARTARPGISVPFEVNVQKDGGWGANESVRIAISADYLNTLQISGMSPEPSSSTADGEFALLEFDPPTGDTLSIDIGGFIDPSANAGRRRAVIRVLDDNDQPLVSASVLTWVLP